MRARMEHGQKAPFEIGDRITAITMTGATTKVRGTIAKVIAPLPADIFGEASSIWEFDIEWDDRKRDARTCGKCGKAVARTDEHVTGLDQVSYLGFSGRRAPMAECCGQPMSLQPAREPRVSEHEIKKLTAVDLIAELGAGEPE